MKYLENMAGYQEDGLIGMEGHFQTYNIAVADGQKIKRGDLLSSGSVSSVFSIAAAGDEDKVLMIAAEDTECSVGTAYGSGIFNREAITFGGASLAIADFEDGLRQQGIFLSSMRG